MIKLGFAADHEGYKLKQQILISLNPLEFDIIDYGAQSLEPQDDYPDFVIPLAQSVASGLIDRGIAICGSGIGASIAANKIRGARAGLIHDLFSAQQGVEDDNMNIICLGARLMEAPFAIELIQCFLQARFSGKTRFMRRLEKISRLEEMKP